MVILGLYNCSSLSNVPTISKDEYKVVKITQHALFFEIDAEQGQNSYKIVSKRSPFIGEIFIKKGQYYKFDLRPLPYYSIRPDVIMLKQDTVSVMTNLGIYNDIIYTNYCDEIIKSSVYSLFYEAINLNGLYIK